jgi:hypothetical protein
VGEVVVGGFGHVHEGWAGGVDGGDDVGLLGGEGWEVGEFVQHEGRVEVRRGEARGIGRMSPRLRTDMTEEGRLPRGERATSPE